LTRSMVPARMVSTPVEHKAAGGGVDEVDDVVEAAAKLVNVFTVKGVMKV